MVFAKSPSNAGVFINEIRRNRPFMALYALYNAVFLPLLLFLMLGTGSAPRSVTDKVSSLTSLLENLSFGPGAVMAAAMAFTAAYISFGHLYTMRSAQFYLALPVTRAQLFIQKASAAAVMLLAPVLLGAFLIIPVLIAYACMTPAAALALLGFLGKSVLAHLLMLALGAACALLTGHVMAAICFFLVANFIVPFLIGFTSLLMEGAVYGLATMNVVGVMNFSPLAYLVSHGNTHMLIRDYPALLGYIALTPVLLAFGCWLYRKRRAEAAGDVVALMRLKPVFKYGVTVCAALLGAVAFSAVIARGARSYEYGWTLLFLLLFGGIGYIVADMLNRRSVRLPAKTFVGYAAYAAAAVLALSSLYYLPYGFVNYQPDVAQCEYVQASSRFTNYFGAYSPDSKLPYNGLKSEEAKRAALALHRYVIDNRETLRATSTSDYRLRDTLRLTYTLVGGGSAERGYELFTDDPGYLDAMAALLNTKEYIDRVFTFPDTIDASIQSCDVATVNGRALMTPTVTVTGAGSSQTRVEVITPEAASQALVLGTQDARRLYDAVQSDLRAGRLGRFAAGTPGTTTLALTFAANIAVKASATDYARDYFSNYAFADYRVSVDERATDTQAVLRELLSLSPSDSQDSRGEDEYSWVYRYASQGISYRHSSEY